MKLLKIVIRFLRIPVRLLKRAVIVYASSGVDNPIDTELVRRVFISNFFGFIGFFFTFPLGIIALFKREFILAGILLFVAAIYLCNYFYLRFSCNHALAAKVILYLHSILMLYLLCTGGVNNTGPLWMYTLPAVLFFMNGFRNGLIDTLFLFVIITAVLFIPGNPIVTADYSISFIVRFMFSLATVAFLSGLHEYSRMRSSFTLLKRSRMFEEAAKTDPLTSLPNRRGMHERLNEEFQKFDGMNNIFSIVIADIDFFKHVNDTYGHDGGDAVLVSLAQKFRTVLRNQDYVSRWGGEEFLILLADTKVNGAIILSEKIRKAVEEMIIIHGKKKIKVTISFGAAEISDMSSIDVVIKRADKMLYKAKVGGRNQVFPKRDNAK